MSSFLFGCENQPKEKGLHLNETYEKKNALQATEIAEIGDEDPLIGTPRGIALNSEGQLYISDFDRDRVHVVSSEGNAVETIGRSGEGPGEFQNPGAVSVGPADSLFVYNRMRRSVSVFGPPPDHEFTYSFRLPLIGDGRTPSGVHKTASGGLLASYGRTKNPNIDGNPGIWIMRVDRNESTPETLYQMPMDEVHIRVENGSHRGVMRPFGRKSFRTYTDTGVCYGWSDSLHVRCGDADGHDSVVVNVNHTPRPVASSEIAFYRNIHDGEELAMIEEAGFHDTHPAYEGFHVDTDERIWVMEVPHRPEEPVDPGELQDVMVTWYRIDPVTETYQTLELPAGQKIKAATDTHVYTTMVVGALPNVWIYRLDS